MPNTGQHDQTRAPGGIGAADAVVANRQVQEASHSSTVTCGLASGAHAWSCGEHFGHDVTRGALVNDLVSSEVTNQHGDFRRAYSGPG